MYHAILFLPLIGSVLAGFFGRWLGDRGAQLVTCGGVVASALLSLVAFSQVALGHDTVHVVLFDWIVSGDFVGSWAMKIDTLTAVMLVVVSGVSALIHIYSIGYMSHDPGIPRFQAYLSLFTFAMLMLVTADNFLQLYFGWEGVGLASYLLIGFWYHKPAANAAAIKAFLVNRVGDFGFALGIAAIFLVFDSVSYDVVFAAVPDQVGKSFHFLGAELDVLTTICVLLFIGAMGKSAQLGLHTWLPDAMEGPTPVSALIHAATMVTAGVFMVARCSPLFEYAPDALVLVTVVGASTAFFAATVALVQTDIKRVIAYSTCSQLGYMFFALGVSAYGAAMFHLFAHAFFKALLFLGAGSVIHAMSGEQDMRNMGGIYKFIPLTYILMWVGSLALAGVPFFAGFYSKDIILESAFAAHTGAGQYAFVLGIAAAFMTAFYSWRLLFMTFHGKSRASEEILSHVHEAPKVMMVPLIILAIGSIGAGFLFNGVFVGDGREAFWGDALFMLGDHDVIEAAHHAPFAVKLLPVLVGAGGIALAWLFYIRRPDLPAMIARAHHEAYLFLLNKWYFDELYDFLFVRPAKRLGHFLWKRGDGTVIDGLGPDGISAAVLGLTRRVVRLQSGYLYHYAFAMLIGVAALASWFVVGSGRGH
jgi:NADH-quinone oxidoreductase subunit L